eukprot:Protomagalhaensia_wolfi_Nauph_80__2044@NODE_22_length_4814_cov_65_182199_g17_i0_p4_GENE_NODE_22_length_4814_cov_65_182199_g17_i0NODE_22_length_4814_cov_65_182199_g17_i0_p4_ORF_typecomplete_len156_score14_35HTH_8/PF02954_19/24HTH_8/PF02954_19/1_6DASH_Duo1/PF08651_10/17DASH_Duo1/PF08651_10/14Tic110/PF16940_5/1_2e03Tic110/PF16940_5/0_34_NODE_22_length_4814_cov_65_182199_g17_i017762243
MLSDLERHEVQALLARTKNTLLSILHSIEDGQPLNTEDIIATSKALVRLEHIQRTLERTGENIEDFRRNSEHVLILEGVSEKLRFRNQVFDSIIESLYNTSSTEKFLEQQRFKRRHHIYALACEQVTRGTSQVSRTDCSGDPLSFERLIVARPFV